MENERVPTLRLPGKPEDKVEDYDAVSEERTELIALTGSVVPNASKLSKILKDPFTISSFL